MKIALSFGAQTSEQRREPYRKALNAVHVGAVENPETLDNLSGLVLTGGTDLDPALYGQARLPETDQPDGERDERETRLLRDALARDIPVLAICRGMQLLNVFCGGTLAQHIEDHRSPGVSNAHSVWIAPESLLASVMGPGAYEVNSRHHQAVALLAPGLSATARAADGTVEALELPDRRFILAVQWHPEDRVDGSDRKLFEAFADALRRTRGLNPLAGADQGR
jgi:putative glutamine amidotransferase